MSRVFLIEEDSMLRSTLTRILASRSLSVHAYWSVVDAFEAIPHVLGGDDVLVVDIDRASKPSEFILKWLDRNAPTSRVVILSTWLVPDDRLGEGWQMLNKPFGASKLLDAVDSVSLATRQPGPPRSPFDA